MDPSRPTRYRFVELRQPRHSQFVLTDTQAAPLPPLDAPQLTEPMHRGANFSEPAPQRPKPLALRFADGKAASLAIAVALAAACAAVVLSIPMGPAP